MTDAWVERIERMYESLPRAALFMAGVTVPFVPVLYALAPYQLTPNKRFHYGSVMQASLLIDLLIVVAVIIGWSRVRRANEEGRETLFSGIAYIVLLHAQLAGAALAVYCALGVC